ncbi:MAG: 16S rRNA (guanine(966)-N(2))-methyltransferase RsmD [Planctomycetota bacterium]|jgi:16S rRNA (guanine(966)-N(2))-methyltransferase RsmD
MRIIGGEFKGRKLKVPRGHHTRPTPDRVREALFSVLGPDVAGTRVVELFAGTGSLGLESLSRGAEAAVFLETDPAALACLHENVERLGVRDRATVLERDALRAARLLESRGPFGLVFCDPPHRLIEDAASRHRLAHLLGAVPLAPGGTALLEHRAGRLGDFLPPGRRHLETREWGSSGIAFYAETD